MSAPDRKPIIRSKLTEARFKKVETKYNLVFKSHVFAVSPKATFLRSEFF